MFPLLLAGFDIDALIAGARKMRDICLLSDVVKNPALLSSTLLYLHSTIAGQDEKQSISINDNFFFNPQLESLGKWYRQLMGESIGKRMDTSGNIVRAGLTPTVSIGSTDLHSIAQLYLGGPLDKFTSFVYAPESINIARVPAESVFPLLAKAYADKDFSEIMNAIFSGTKEAYRKNKLPFMEVILPEISEEILGQYLQWKMMEMMFLAKLLNVNAFDQPRVEDYKKETRRFLGSEINLTTDR